MARQPLPVGLIEIRVGRIEQLFESLDPSPFHARDLGRDTASYILSWAGDLPESSALGLRIVLPETEKARDEAALIPQAVGHHFGYLALIKERELRELFRLGRRYLAIGIVTLALCLAGSQIVQAKFGDAPLARVVRESLIILGWVSNWKPLETFLYDWWPIRRQLTLLRRLAAAPVDVRG